MRLLIGLAARTFLNLKVLAFIAFAVGFTGVSVSAQCTASSCPDQTILEVPTNPYQMNPHSKVRHVLVHDRGCCSSHPTSKSAMRRNLARLAAQYGFRLTFSSINNYVTDSTLAGVDVLVLVSGDGDVFNGVGTVSSNAARKFVERDGKGLLMIHAAAAFVPCPNNGEEDTENPLCRFIAQVAVRQYYHHNADTTSARIYADSTGVGELPANAYLGGDSTRTRYISTPALINHGRRNPETRMIFENLPRNTPTGNQPYIWDGLRDEWYNFRVSPRHQGAQILNGVAYGPVNVLLSIDENSYAEVAPSMGDHPIAWTRKVGKGLGLLNTAGHSDIFVRARQVDGITVDDSLMQKFTWRSVRYLSRDFVGCMDPGFEEYNPEASVTVLSPGFDDPQPCKTAVSLRPRVEARQGGASILTAEARRIRVTLLKGGSHSIHVTDVNGQTVFTRTAEGAGDVVESHALRPGIYFVRILSPAETRIVERVNLY